MYTETSEKASFDLGVGGSVKRSGEKNLAAGHLSVLLGTAASGGTIASVRELAANGIKASVISSDLLSPAAWSRRAARTYRAPRDSEEDEFIARLMEIGAANPGQILLPTSDQTAWLYTLHAEQLQKHFVMYQPSVDSMKRILDKNLFAEAVGKAGLSVLPSWEAKSLDEIVTLAPSLPYPILIKPRTHVHRARNDKGLVARSKAELIQKYQRFVDLEQSEDPALRAARLPVLQQYVDQAKEGVYSVSGFLDRSGELFVTRRSIKVFQRSQPVGVGICFESMPADPELSSAVRRLCKELDYFGMFEVEFIRFDQGWAAIDFNARLFNQVGLDLLRGMPVPLFACLDAAGETAALREAVAKAQAVDESKKAVFYDRFTLRAILMARTLTRRISSQEKEHWRNWTRRNEANCIDFAIDPKDPAPGIVHALSEIYLGLKAFPRFLRSMPRTSPEVENALAKVRS
jgi:predicted ATP-grasp superfamily ATP-dependent carboligase